MICQTTKAGTECVFMSKKGCGFNGGTCHTIIDKCESCNKVMIVEAGQYCRIYPDPTSKWGAGRCPQASHVKREVVETTQKINPLKASKRSNKH